MKTLTTEILVILILFGGAVEAETTRAQRKPGLAVVPFKVLGGKKVTDGGMMISERLLPHFAFGFSLVDQSQLKALLAQQDLSLAMLSEVSRQQYESKLVKLVSVKLLVLGTLSCYPDGTYHVTARMTDWRTGKIQSAIGQAKANNWSELMSQMPKLASFLLQGKADPKITVRYWVTRATEVAKSISDSKKRRIAFEELCNRAWRSGDFVEAVKLTQNLEYPYDEFRDIACGQARSGLFEAALATAERFETKFNKFQAYCDIADSMLELGNTESFEKVIGQAKQAVLQSKPQPRGSRPSRKLYDKSRRLLCLAHVIESLCKGGKIDEAHELGKNLDLSGKNFTRYYWAVSKAELKAKRIKDANRSFQALKSISHIKKYYGTPMGVYARIAELQFRNGLQDAANVTMKEALRFKDIGRGEVWYCGAYANVAASMHIMGRTKEADAILEDILKIAGTSKSPEFSLHGVSLAMTRYGSLKMAAKVSDSIKEPFLANGPWSKIAEAHARAGRWRDAILAVAKIKERKVMLKQYNLVLGYQTRSRDLTGIADTLGNLLKILKSEETQEARDEILATVAGAQIRLREFDALDATINRIDSRYWRVMAYCKAADALLLDGYEYGYRDKGRTGSWVWPPKSSGR